MKKKDSEIDVSNNAGRKALYEIIELLDENMKSKVIEMMKNRRVVS